MYLTTLLEGLDDQKLIPPRKPLCGHCKTVGELPDELKRLYSRMTSVQRDCERLGLEVLHCDDEAARAELQKKRDKMITDYIYLNAVYILEMGVHLDVKDMSNVMVGSDWQVGIHDESPFLDRLHELFGPGLRLTEVSLEELIPDESGSPKEPAPTEEAVTS